MALKLWVDLEDDPILVALCVQRRDLPLGIGVVERVGDILHPDTQPRRRRPVDCHVHLQTALLAVRRYVHKPGHPLNSPEHARCPPNKLTVIGIPQRELIGRIGLPAPYPNILHRKEKHAQSRDIRGLLPQARDNGLGSGATALRQRLEADEKRAAVHRRAPSRRADRGADGCYCGIGSQNCFRLLLQVVHRLE